MRHHSGARQWRVPCEECGNPVSDRKRMHSQVSKSNLSFFISERRVDDDAGWSYLSFHDRRRTWATALACEDVDPLLVRDWDGWNDLETFLDHSRGTFSPDSAEAGARRRRVALTTATRSRRIRDRRLPLVRTPATLGESRPQPTWPTGLRRRSRTPLGSRHHRVRGRNRRRR